MKEDPERHRLEFPLARVRDALAAGEPLAGAASAVAARLGLRAASLLAAAESHPDLVAAQGELRVCRGTSCELAGARSLRAAARAAGPLREVHCLGHCDRSPTLLGTDHGVRVAVDASRLEAALASAAPPPRPAIRTLRGPAIVTRRVARGDFSALADARADGAYRALERARARAPEELVAALERSGERGRGGAGFATGAKWRACARAEGQRRVAIANGDEGDPGSFIDRVLMEDDPHGVLEGLALCAHAIGAREAVVFVRSEYPRAAERMERAAAAARAAGCFGSALHVRVVRGFGSYVCGEETALLAALEGERAEVRPRPPFPTERGLFGLPTVIHNVETLANVPWILEHGPEAYAALGSERCRGTKALCLSAGFAAPGIVEVPFGVSLREVIERAGGTSCTRADLEGVLVGGPMGSFLRPERCDLPIDPEAMREAGCELGHGGIVAVRAGADLAALARHLLDFMAEESCGRCTPCRVGGQRARSLFAAQGAAASEALAPLFELMEATSLCGFGRATPRPVRQLLAALRESAA